MSSQAIEKDASPDRSRGLPLIGGISGRQLTAAAVGNLLEWFDWNAYAFLAVYFSPLFFPKGTSALVALLGSFGILAIGFLCRPLAGLVIGFLADRVGRKPALLMTVWGMGIASALMALTPTYAQIGVAAPLLLLLARVLQGLCIGGEYSSIAAFAMEMAPRGKRGRVAAFLTIVAALGQMIVVLLILLLVSFLPAAAMGSYGWRIIFGIAALLSLAGVWMRSGMTETLHAKTAVTERIHVLSALVRFPKQSLMIVGMILGFTAMVYAYGAYMPAYATTYVHLDTKYTMTAMLISLALSIVAAVPAGWLSDRWGRKATMVLAGILLSVGTVPLLGLLNSNVWTLVVAQSFGLVVLMLLQASSMPALAEMFGGRFRAAGLGFPYSLTVGVIGGTVPMVGTALAGAGAHGLFPWYLTGLMVISTLVYLAMKETAFTPLPE